MQEFHRYCSPGLCFHAQGRLTRSVLAYLAKRGAFASICGEHKPGSLGHEEQKTHATHQGLQTTIHRPEPSVHPEYGPAIHNNRGSSYEPWYIYTHIISLRGPRYSDQTISISIYISMSLSISLSLYMYQKSISISIAISLSISNSHLYQQRSSYRSRVPEPGA